MCHKIEADTLDRMKQPILVLGANGFIGRRVIAALAVSGWAEPIAGVRRAGTPAAIPVKQCVVDATNAGSMRSALQGVSAVVNCTAPPPAQIVSSVEALVQAITDDIRVVHLSTMSVYGSATGLLDETAPLRGDLGEYSAAKVAAEAVVIRYPRTIIFRPGCVYGPESAQWSLRFAQYLLAHRLGDLGAAGDGYCNLVHVDDVAAAVVRAVENPQTDGRVYNLSSSSPPTWNEYLVRYARALGAVPVRRISGRKLKIETKILAPPLKIAEILARICRLDPGRLPPPIPPSLARLMSQEIRLSTVRAEQELAMRWKDLDSGVAEAARWCLEPGRVR
jgi:nucleoside-diphosphate-sugar epimerase